MLRRMSNWLKRFCIVFLIVILLMTMMPVLNGMDTVYGATIGTFHYGSKVVDAKGRCYHWKKSMSAPAYWWDADGNRIIDHAATFESADAGMERYQIKTGGRTINGYCVAHGIRVDTTTRLSAEDSLEDWAHTASYPESSRKGIEYALAYGYQDGRGIKKLESKGFEDSRWYEKHADEYTDGDYYIATQIIIWEYQQLIRTDSIDGGHGRKANGLVDANHYYDVIKGRAAQDIYDYIVDCIKKHQKIAGFAYKTKKECEKKSRGYTMRKNPDGTYSLTLTDRSKINADIEASGLSKEKWTIDREGNKYTFTYKGQLTQEGTVFKFSKKHPLIDSYKGGDMLIWSWSSAGSLRQAVATGVKSDPIPMYIKFQKGSFSEFGDDEPQGERPKPEFFPTFQFPVEKEDLNPGWDGDNHTGMGDASLASTFTLFRSINDGDWEEVDAVTLDEYGNRQVLSDQPWLEDKDFIENESGAYEHFVDAKELHCVVRPEKITWSGRIKYKVVETRPMGRFIEPDSGVRDTYEAEYEAETRNCRKCIDEDEQWSSIVYTLRYNDDKIKETLTGRLGENGIDENGEYSFGTMTFVNDCYRGRLFISKSNESEDVFNEEGNSGGQEKSRESKWKIRLNSGGWEEHPYIRFADEGLTESGTRKYRVVRDGTGIDNAVLDLVVGTNGCIYVYDMPYGLYTVEEVAADDESFVLESFEQMIDEHTSVYEPDNPSKDPRYDWNLRNKKKENVIKVIKTDAQTGKPVALKGTKFYIRYMGNHLLEDPSKSENYGRLLPNASDMNSTGKDYTFQCNANGEIVLPYDLKFGTYRIEEFLLPDGYFVGVYDKEGHPHNADFGISKEYGMDDDGKAKTESGWESLYDNDPENDILAVYDKDGQKIQYKAGDVFNFYTFKVEKQDGHMHGNAYTKYYKAVSMANNPVKGKIQIAKQGETFAGFEKKEKNGYIIWSPKYIWSKLKDAVFGIYAAIDTWLNDGTDGAGLYDSNSKKPLKIPVEKSTHSGIDGKGSIYDEGILHHSSGAKVYFKKERDISADNHYTRIYATPEQRPASYAYTVEKEEKGLKYRYDVSVQMRYSAGGYNYTDISVTKATSVAEGFAPEIPTTEATCSVGNRSYSPAVNVADDKGNLFDINKRVQVYEADGSPIYDMDGELIADLGGIDAKRYVVRDYSFYQLTEDDVKKEQRTDDKGEIITKTAFEWENGVELVNPSMEGRAVKVLKNNRYQVLTENFDWVDCDASGIPFSQYQIPEGWTELPYIPQVEIEEDEVNITNVHYAIVTKTEDDKIKYKVLLDDQKTWQDCQANGNFKKMMIETYETSYTQQGGNEVGFTFQLDGFTVFSQAQLTGAATTVIETPFDVEPEISMGIGYQQRTEGNVTTFSAIEPSAPVYFLSEDGIKTEMYYFGNRTKTLLTIPMKAVEGNFESVIPKIIFTRTGEEIDWFSPLTPDKPVLKREAAFGNTVTAIRHEGNKTDDVYFTIEIISDQTMKDGDGPFEITYPDGYIGKIYTAESETGNHVGVLVLDGICKTSVAALSDLVDVITTDENGTATSKELPLGKYIVRELSAPEGYVADTERVWEAELKYKDQYTPLVWDNLKARNTSVKVELDLSKVFETGYQTGTYSPGSGAVFGLYNAEQITYGKEKLAADTLMDVLEVNAEGKALAEVKLPSGIYYVKELETRPGYRLNNIPFYFAAKDTDKSKPLYISKDEDGEDSDGMTAKAVMDGFGKARITIETLHRYPEAEIIVNGKTYTLDHDIKEGNITVKIHEDMSRAVVIVTDKKPVEMILPNGKVLCLEVKGNTYRYHYDGMDGTYIPKVMYTGYCATYDIDGKKNSDDRFFTLSAADKLSTMRLELVRKDGSIGEKEDFYVKVNLSKGQLVEAVLGKEKLDVSALRETEICVKKGNELKLNADDGSIYLISIKKDGAMQISVGNVLTGKLTESDGPALSVDGRDRTNDLQVFKSVTMARQDSSAKSVQVKINSLDDINAEDIKNDMIETPSKPDVPHRQEPSIKTSVMDMNTKEHIVSVGSEVTLIDKVSYRGLIPGETYVLRGKLVERETGQTMKNGDKPITAETSFTAEKTAGIVDVFFSFNGLDFAGKTGVVFEELYLMIDRDQDGVPDTVQDKPCASHTQLEDENQTVYFPKVCTTASHDTVGTVEDVVKYSNLIPQKRYTVKGTLMDKATGRPVVIDGKVVRAEKTFVPETSDGQVIMRFDIDEFAVNDFTGVVFEKLYLGEVLIASHEDFHDKEQTVEFEQEDTLTKGIMVVKPDSKQFPKTGDDGGIVSWMLLAAATVSVLMRVFVKKRRNRI